MAPAGHETYRSAWNPHTRRVLAAFVAAAVLAGGAYLALGKADDPRAPAPSAPTLPPSPRGLPEVVAPSALSMRSAAAKVLTLLLQGNGEEAVRTFALLRRAYGWCRLGIAGGGAFARERLSEREARAAAAEAREKFVKDAPLGAPVLGASVQGEGRRRSWLVVAASCPKPGPALP